MRLLAAALGCSVAELLDGSPDPMVVFRPGDEPRGRIGTLEGRLLHRFTPTGPVEILEITLATTRKRTSPPHPDGVYEHVWVAEGRVATGPEEDPIELGPGDYACFPGWHRHHYRALQAPVRMLMMLSLRRYLPETPSLHHGLIES